MSTEPESHAVTASSDSPPAKAELLADDLDLADAPLGERQPEACSMEEGCERCQ